MDHLFKPHFPNLTNVQAKKTSDETPNYNCIAWAFKDSRKYWWPNPRAYWPLSCAGLTVPQAFDDLFDKLGWQETTEHSVEAGVDKIALYTINSMPTHAARLLPNGLWTSKLGRGIDLSHSLSDLDGPTYGTVTKVYMKGIHVPTKSPPAP